MNTQSIGQKFGRLTIIKVIPKHKTNNRCQFLCECDCGQIVVVNKHDLKNNNTRSCGCLKKELLIKRSTKHGHSRRKIESNAYRSWRAIRQRCDNPNCAEYKNYGGRGISICEQWNNFLYFIKDMGNPPTNKHQINRIDNNGNYCKDNCRWSTPKEQSRNTRQNQFISFNGTTKCIMDWAISLNINPKTLYTRFHRGWSIKRALTTTIKTGNYNGR